MAPIPFFNEVFVDLFNEGVSLLKARAESGDADGQRRLLDVRGARGAACLCFEALGDVWFVLADGELTSVAERPPAEPVRLAIVISGAFASRFMGHLMAGIDKDREHAAENATRVASLRFQEAVGEEPLVFHVMYLGVPEHGDLVVQVGLSTEEAPTDPDFTVTLKWSDIDRSEPVRVQDLFMAGKLKLRGDYSRAMAIALELMDDD